MNHNTHNRIPLSSRLSISRLTHGQMRFAEWKLNAKEILALIEELVEIGITSFDHADIYGGQTCEGLFGNALKIKPGMRKEIQLISKCGIVPISPLRPDQKTKYYNTNKSHIIKSVEQSIKSFHTDYLDLFLIHRPDPYMNPEEVAEAFEELRKQGKVLDFGVSNFLPSQFNMLESYLSFPLVTNQVEISPVCLTSFQNGTMEQCQEKRISPMAWSPLGRGKLEGNLDEKSELIVQALEKIKREVAAESIYQIVLAWLLNHPGNIIPIIGSGNIARIKELVKSLEIKLTTEQWFEIWQSSTGKQVD
jgi:predicted oxidoreductase